MFSVVCFVGGAVVGGVLWPHLKSFFTTVKTDLSASEADVKADVSSVEKKL